MQEGYRKWNMQHGFTAVLYAIRALKMDAVFAMLSW